MNEILDRATRTPIQSTSRTQVGDDAGSVWVQRETDGQSADNYRRLVQQVILDCLSTPERISRAFETFGDTYAAVIIETMLSNAQEEVLIFARELDSSVWQASWLSDFCNRVPNGLVKVIIEEMDAASSDRSALSLLHSAISSGQIQVRYLARSASEEQRPHIVIADSQHVRIETDQIKRRGTVVFANVELGKTAALLFSRLWEKSSPTNVNVTPTS